MLKIESGSDVYKTSTQPTILSLGSSLICLQVYLFPEKRVASMYCSPL